MSVPFSFIEFIAIRIMDFIDVTYEFINREFSIVILNIFIPYF